MPSESLCVWEWKYIPHSGMLLLPFVSAPCGISLCQYGKTIFPMGRTLSDILTCYALCLDGEMTRCVIACQLLIMANYLANGQNWKIVEDWKNGSKVKRIFCSSSGSKFSSQHPHGAAHYCLYLQLQGIHCLLWFPQTCAMHTQIVKHKFKSNNFEKEFWKKSWRGHSTMSQRLKIFGTKTWQLKFNPQIT